MHHSTSLPLIVTLSSMLWMGCGDPPVAPVQSKPDLGMTPDQGPDLKPSCTPTTCEQLGEVCGMQDDGCGGALDCGACSTCPATPQPDAGCGPCELGVPSCDEVNGVTCNLPELPGLDADTCAAAILYVDSAHAGEQTGSKNAPFKSIGAALEASHASTKLIAIRSNELYRESVTAKDGVHLVGGFDEAWRYQTKQRAIINAPAPDDADVFGLRLENIQSPTVFANLSVNTEDASAEHSNYALYANNAGAARLIQIKTLAGKGGDGKDGSDGQSGTDGLPGTDGKPGGVQYSTGQTPNPAYGIGGTSPMSACGQQGNDGGDGARLITTGSALNPRDIKSDPQSGEDDLLGGGPGIYRLVGIPNYLDGQNGRDASVNSSAPQSGVGGRRDISAVTDGIWSALNPSHGEDGADGEAGLSGGGGGGGYFQKKDPPNEIGGPGGGSGGLGGCGGLKGLGGRSGSASFGLFAYNSESIILSSSSFQSSSGGAGGHGGKGGEPGKGQEGGKGSEVICNWRNTSYESNGVFVFRGEYFDCTPARSKGADGGKGADGQRGGSGGGGAGGPSYGAFCVGTTVDTLGEVTFLAGPSAQGGLGGDNQGNDGERGLSINEYQCVND